MKDSADLLQKSKFIFVEFSIHKTEEIIKAVVQLQVFRDFR